MLVFVFQKAKSPSRSRWYVVLPDRLSAQRKLIGLRLVRILAGFLRSLAARLPMELHCLFSFAEVISLWAIFGADGLRKHHARTRRGVHAQAAFLTHPSISCAAVGICS